MASNFNKRTQAALISLMEIIIITLISSLTNQVKQKRVAEQQFYLTYMGTKGKEPYYISSPETTQKEKSLLPYKFIPYEIE